MFCLLCGFFPCPPAYVFFFHSLRLWESKSLVLGVSSFQHFKWKWFHHTPLGQSPERISCFAGWKRHEIFRVEHDSLLLWWQYCAPGMADF
jgi:hypothetical protein